MTATTEMSCDFRHIEGIFSGSQTQLHIAVFRFFDQKGKIASIQGGEDFIDELRTELVFRDSILFEGILADIPPNDGSSLERYESIEHVPVELEIIELLAFVRVKYNLFVVRSEGYEFTGDFKGTGSDAVLETVRVPDDAK